MRHSLTGIVAVASVCFSAGVAKADFSVGNDLLRDCRSEGPAYIRCLGYIEGVTDAIRHGRVLGWEACIPPDAEAAQLKDIVVLYFARNAATRHLAAVGEIGRALSEAFPCR